MRVGGAVLVLGMLATVVAFSPLISGVGLGPIWWALSMLTGLGLVLMLVGFRSQAKSRSQQLAAFKGEL